MTSEIDVGLIYSSPHARALDKAKVKQLAESISNVGLINPVCVRRVTRHRGITPFEAFDIVAGHHRYEAMVSLRMEKISCIIMDCDDLHAELAEIDENLIRTPLTPSQEAEAIWRRKVIYEELHPETRNGATGNGREKVRQIGEATPPDRFTAATAAATGKPERNVQRAAARGAALGGDLQDIAGTALDKGVELDALAKLPKEEREPIIARAKAGEKVSARKPRKVPAEKPPKIAADPLPDNLASERQVARLMDAWNAAGPDAREEFLLRIDTPVMDRSAAE